MYENKTMTKWKCHGKERYIVFCFNTKMFIYMDWLIMFNFISERGCIVLKLSQNTGLLKEYILSS